MCLRSASLERVDKQGDVPAQCKRMQKCELELCQAGCLIEFHTDVTEFILQFV